MISVRCPQCGAPVLASLATPDAIRCASCGFHGPPDAEAAPRLRQAADVLARVEARHRQLTDKQRTALGTAAETAARHRKVLFAALTPLLLLGACGAFGTLRGEGDMEKSVLLLIFALPPVLSAASGLVMIALLRYRTEQLAARCAAVPSSPGQPARCHTCGAELVETAAAFARCPFCGADNFLETAAMERAAGARASSAGSIEADVAHQLEALRRAGVGSRALAVTSVVAAPIASFVATVLLVVLFSKLVRRPADELRRYVVVETVAGRCIARVSHADRDVLEFDDRAPAGVPQTLPRPVGAKDFAVTALLTRDVLTHLGRGRIERVFRTVDSRGNSADIVLPNGQTLMPKAVLGLCLPPDVSW